MLWLCVSQKQNPTPYVFKTTGVQVFSFEEALYYVFHNWKEAAEDVLTPAMIDWVKDIGLPAYAAKMRRLADLEAFAQRILGFLSIVQYFDADELASLDAHLESWGRRLDWEKLKERGDFFARQNQLERARAQYQRALAFEQNPQILNNLAYTLLQTGNFADACANLAAAHAIAPKDTAILQNLAEAAVLAHDFDLADDCIKQLAAKKSNAAVCAYLQGLVCFERKQFLDAQRHFAQAQEMDAKNPLFAHKAADALVQMRQYAAALEVLQNLPAQDASTHVGRASVYAASGDYTKAAASMHHAISLTRTPDAIMHTKLAQYLRLDYAPQMALQAIEAAIAMSPEHDIVRLEYARIKKSLGDMRQYQEILSDLLGNLRDKYRD